MSSPVMPVMPLKRVEVWTDTVCNSGVRQSVVPVVAGSLTEEITNSLVVRQLALTTTRYADVDDLIVRRVLRLTWSDDTYLELRISEIADASGGDGLVRLTALDLIYDLAERDELVSRVVNNVVQYEFEISGDYITLLNTWLPPVTPSYIPTGSSSASNNVTVQVSNDTALSLALKLLHANELATGGYYEWYLTRNGTTQYEWYTAQYNNSAAFVDIRTAKNLLKTNRRTQRLGDFTNRIIPFGSDGGTHGGAWWKVTAVTVNTYIEITEIGGNGVNPILADDQFNTTFYWIHEDGVSHQITDTDRTNKRLYMASTTGIATGEWGRIANNSSGDYLPYLDHPTSQASYGVRMGVKTFDSPTHTNWCKNGTLAAWSGGMPDDWTSPSGSDPVKTTTTGYWETAGWSARLNGGAGSYDAQATRTFALTAGDTVTYVVRLRVTSLASTLNPNNGYIELTDPQTTTVTRYKIDGTESDLTTLGQFYTFSRSFSITTTGSKTLTFYTYANSGGGLDYYLDNVQFVINAASTTPEAVNGSGAALVWLKAAQYLDINDAPLTSYEVALIDLYRIDPTLWSAEALALGAYITLVDTELGTTASTQLRVLKIVADLLNPANTTLTLASNLEQFTRLLTA